MPPSVACALVDTSTGEPQAVLLQLGVGWSSTMPGSTSTALRRPESSESTRRSCLLWSITSAAQPSGRTGWCRRRAAAAVPGLATDVDRSRFTTSRLRGTLGRRWADLVDRRVGGVAAARGDVEQHLALRCGAALREPARPFVVDRREHGAGGGAFMPAPFLRAELPASSSARAPHRACASGARSAARAGRRHRRGEQRPPCARARDRRASTSPVEVGAEAQRLQPRVDVAPGLRQHRVAGAALISGVDLRIDAVVAGRSRRVQAAIISKCRARISPARPP